MPRIDEVLVAIQRDLFSLGALLATPDPDKVREHLEKARIGDARIAELERAIDDGEAELEPLRAFILPGGTVKAAALHLARTSAAAPSAMCSRCRAREPLPPIVVIYLNRLSDLLFVLARVADASRGRGGGDVVSDVTTARAVARRRDHRRLVRGARGRGLLDRAAEIIRTAAPAHRYAIISDANVAPLYAARLRDALGAARAHGALHDSRRRGAQDARAVGAPHRRAARRRLRTRHHHSRAGRRRRRRSRGLRRRDVHARHSVRAASDDAARHDRCIDRRKDGRRYRCREESRRRLPSAARGDRRSCRARDAPAESSARGARGGDQARRDRRRGVL